ncbi:MAG: DUF1206 domain-containing protein [Tepidisphaeraceae bacterium]
MTTLQSNLDQANADLRQARHKAGPFVEGFVRFGYAAKGVVYCVVGSLAAIAAFGSGGDATGSRGALDKISHQPFGWVMLAIVAVGLSGYAMWQFIRSIEDPEDEGSNAKAIFRRIGIFGSGLIHLGLVIYAVNIIIGWRRRGGGDDESARSWSATAMSYPMGRWLLAAAGIGLLCYGVWQLIRSFQSNLDKRLHLGEIKPETRRFVVQVSRFGLAARGIVFGIMGIFLALAAWHHNSSQAKGVGGALDALQRQPYGPWLLGIVALGLIAYGIYQFVEARYRQITST